MPGLAIKCDVRFTATEFRYYYDAIRIHGPSEENLTIPLHAYPTLGHQIIPENLRFSGIPVGHSQMKLIPLCNVSPVTFEFRVILLQPNPCFDISPLDGDIPANGTTQIRVRYAPHDFTTQHCAIQIDTSQFNAKPIVCKITGSSAPGLEREYALQALDEPEKQADVVEVTSPQNNEGEVDEEAQVEDDGTQQRKELFERRKKLDTSKRSGTTGKRRGQVRVNSRLSSTSASSSSGVASEDVGSSVPTPMRQAREDTRIRKAIAKGSKSS